MPEEFKSKNEEDNTKLTSSIPNLILYIIILIISFLLMIAIIIFIIRKIKQTRVKKHRSNSSTPNIHFKSEEPPSVMIRNDKITANTRQQIEISSNIDKTTDNRSIIESISVPPRLSNNPNSGDFEISKTFNSETYTENEESNDDKIKKNDVVVITDITTKTTNM